MRDLKFNDVVRNIGDIKKSYHSDCIVVNF